MMNSSQRQDDKQKLQTSGNQDEATEMRKCSGASRAPRDLVRIHQLIDLKDHPIRMTRDELSWSRVRSTASNCICCCCSSSSITLVTTDDSYLLDHIPLSNIQQAQANSSLQYLALANEHKLAIIDLVESPQQTIGPTDSAGSSLSRSASSSSASSGNSSTTRRTNTKLVNLNALGLTMKDVLFWRWLDEFELALVTQEALFTCAVNQLQINHPALSAFTSATSTTTKTTVGGLRLLSMVKVCDVRASLSKLCQITDVQRDQTAGCLYAISALYSSSRIRHQQATSNNNPNKLSTNKSSPPGKLKHQFNSVPGRLYQMASSEQSFSSLEAATGGPANLYHPHNATYDNNAQDDDDDDHEIHGLVQIYCSLRDCTQLIPAQAVAFAQLTDKDDTSSTTLVTANRQDDRLRVHLIGMATEPPHFATNGQSASPSTKFHSLGTNNKFDFPTSIVCSTIDGDDDENSLHVAMITTKFGQLYLCSVTYGTILFNVRITSDIISNTVLDDKTQGLMVICRNGQVLLVELDRCKLSCLLNESRSLKPISSQANIDSLSSAKNNNNNNNNDDDDLAYATTTHDNSQAATPLDIGLEVLISTKL